ncbi:MAG: pyridoxal phosphate-dependent aminotransferase [Planctomycetota bacterium]|jgi:aspartate aminotransferase
MPKLADRIGRVGESVTLAVTAKAKAMKADGIDVVAFAAGEPDFDTPAYVSAAGKAAIDAGQTRYTPATGTPDLKKAVAAKLERDSGLTYDPAREVMISCGAKHVIYNLVQVLCGEGQEVVVPAPYWVSYPEMAKLAGGEPVFPAAGADQEFKLTPAQLEKAITAKTAVVLLNSPSNPTGSVYSREELTALAEVLAEKDVWVISDEIYEKLVYDGVEHCSIAALNPDLRKRTLTVNGHSKAYAMTGWRIGYAAGPAGVIKAAGSLQSHSTSGPSTMCQAAALAALTENDGGAAELEAMRTEFQKRRDLIVDRLNALPGVSCVKPRGAFYVFPDFSACYGREIGGAKVDGSLSLCAAALEAAHVALVPGIAFGEDKCVRMSFAASSEMINKGLDRLEKLLKS